MPTMLSRFTRRGRSADEQAARRPGEIDLSAEGARVVIVPERGGRITVLELGGRQWLADEDVSPSDADAARGGSTGYEECFPTVAACRLVSRNSGLAIELPALGEVRTMRPAIRVTTLDGALEAVSTWTGERFAYRFTRGVRVSPGTIRMRYAITNTGAASLPFLWASNIALPLGAETRISLPESARGRVLAQSGVDFLGVGAEHKWPRFRTAKKLVDMTKPDEIGPRFACHLAFDMPGGVVGIAEGAHRLEARFDETKIPQLGLALRKRTGTGLARGLTLQPAIGVPDVLAHGAGVSTGVPWLEPGETREWDISWRSPAE
jgi:galactose mutarotase-like enzyme